MSPWIIYVAVSMDTEVELLSIHNKALIKRREEEELVAAETVESNSQESVITARVTGHNGRVAICACLVGADNLPLQRIRKIYQL